MTAVKTALEYAYEQTRKRFVDDGNAVPFLFGWRKREEQIVQGRRIVWIPGGAGGDLGQVAAARKTHTTTMRPLANLDELFTVLIFGTHAATPEDELSQYRSARLLYDAWLRAMYLAMRGSFRVQSQRWLTEHKERVWGACIELVCSVQAVVPDEPYDPGEQLDLPHVVLDGVNAEATLEELDHSEEI